MPGAAGLRRRVWMTGKTGRGMRPWPRALRTLYKAWACSTGVWGPYTRLAYNLYNTPSARPWVGRTDAEQEEDWDSNKKILTRAPLPSSATDIFLPLEYFWSFLNSFSVKLLTSASFTRQVKLVLLFKIYWMSVVLCCASAVLLVLVVVLEDWQKVSDTCEVWPPSAPNVGTCNRDKKKLTHWRWDWVRAKCAKVFCLFGDGIWRCQSDLFAVAVRKIWFDLIWLYFADYFSMYI